MQFCFVFFHAENAKTTFTILRDIASNFKINRIAGLIYPANPVYPVKSVCMTEDYRKLKKYANAGRTRRSGRGSDIRRRRTADRKLLAEVLDEDRESVQAAIEN